LLPGSSAVEQPAVNRLVDGSNPSRGANKIKDLIGESPRRKTPNSASWQHVWQQAAKLASILRIPPPSSFGIEPSAAANALRSPVRLAVACPTAYASHRKAQLHGATQGHGTTASPTTRAESAKASSTRLKPRRIRWI
jgi:hypothetical protein